MVLGEDSGVTIGFASAVFVAFITVWWRIETKFASQAAELAKDAKDLDAYKLRVAETYATRQGAGQAIDRATDEIKGLRSDFKDGLVAIRSEMTGALTNLGDRIERMETHMMSPPRGGMG